MELQESSSVEKREEVKEVQVGIKVHTFQGKISEDRVYFQITNFGHTLYIWIGNSDGKMNDLSLAAPTPYDTSKALPTTTKIIGSAGENSSETLAAKLSKRLGKPVLMSLNLQLLAPYWSEMEKILIEEIKLKPQHFQ